MNWGWTKKDKRQQRARARGRSTVFQAGGDMHVVDVKYVIEHAETFRDLLEQGEHLANGEDPDHFSQNDSVLWGSAERSIWTVSLYGRKFMPPQHEIAELASRVPIRIALLDPESEIAIDVAKGKAMFSRTRTQENVWEQIQGPAREQWFMQGFRTEVTATIDMVKSIKTSNPNADIELRLISSLPRWKGTIVDGQRAVYVMYDVPRQEVPFRWTENVEAISWYKKIYVDDCWNRASSIIV